jgi:hypothetical protein
VHTGCLSAAPQRFVTVQTAFALSPALKYRSAPILTASHSTITTFARDPLRWPSFGSQPRVSAISPIEGSFDSKQIWGKLEVKSHFRRIRARCHKMCAAEGRKKVVECNLVGHVDYREAKAPFVAIAVKQIVMTRADVKQVPRRHAGRVMIVIFGSWSRKANARRSIQGPRPQLARCRTANSWRSTAKLFSAGIAGAWFAETSGHGRSGIRLRS